MTSARASAPGQVYLLGEHTGSNGGLVLSASIPQRTAVALERRSDARVHALSRQLDPPIQFSLGGEKRRGDWSDAVQGVTWALREAGHRLEGFEVAVDSEVPSGAGLSKGASLAVALLKGLRELFALQLDDLALARLAHRAQSGFAGGPAGPLEPMACALAGSGEALFLDGRTLEHQRVPLPEGCALLVIDSGVPLPGASSELRARRAECERAAKLLGVAELRDVRGDRPVPELPEPLDRRVRHVVSENARVLAAAQALRERELPTLGQLMNESHESLRDDFEVSVPRIELLVALACAEPGVFGARLTGPGFGGAIVALVEKSRAAAAGAEVVRRYEARDGHAARLLVPVEPPAPG